MCALRARLSRMSMRGSVSRGGRVEGAMGVKADAEAGVVGVLGGGTDPGGGRVTGCDSGTTGVRDVRAGGERLSDDSGGIVSANGLLLVMLAGLVSEAVDEPAVGLAPCLGSFAPNSTG